MKGFVRYLYVYQYDNFVLLPRDLFNPIINDKGFAGTLTNHSHCDSYNDELVQGLGLSLFLDCKTL